VPLLLAFKLPKLPPLHLALESEKACVLNQDFPIKTYIMFLPKICVGMAPKEATPLGKSIGFAGAYISFGTGAFAKSE